MSTLNEHFTWLKDNWETRDSIKWQGIAVVFLYAHLDELISLQADAQRNPTIKEQLEILRRIAERGLKKSHELHSPLLDLFQHMLDELRRTDSALSIEQQAPEV